MCEVIGWKRPQFTHKSFYHILIILLLKYFFPYKDFSKQQII